MSSQEFKRKLTAVFSADVAGYSRLMGEDETATVKTVEAYKQVMFALIQQHRGRLIDSPGDNLLAEFASVVDAVQCGVAVQKELQARNADLPESRRMQFRIGINLGDVIEEGDRIYGDGVNIAARLESCADPGGICISKTTFDQIETKLPLGYEFLGEQEVKNIARPVGAYRVLMEPRVTVAGVKAKRVKAPLGRYRTLLAGAIVVVLVVVIGAMAWKLYRPAREFEPASKQKMAFPLPDKPSIAVLPFANMSGDPGQEFLSDGITENIITGLSQLNALFVIARNSTFAYKGKPVKIQQVAEDLGVRYVLEGSVKRSGDRLRITAQFIDALKGHHLWSERYDRELKDLFAIEDDITKKIITALQVVLTQGEQARVYSRGTENLDAYLKFMEGREHNLRFNKDANLVARQRAEEAIALDPKYSVAHAILGKTYIGAVFFGWSPSPKEALGRAYSSAKKALSLDESNFGAHTTLAFVHLLRREHDEAVRESERAVELAPNAADSFYNLGIVLRFAGRVKEAIPAFERAIRLNPIPPASYLYQLALSYTFVGEFEKAVRLCNEAISKNPDDLVGRVTLIIAYGSLGREEDARAQVSELLRVDPKFSLEQAAKTWPYKKEADREFVLAALRKAGLSDKPPLPLPDKPSIAVLPFDNMSGDPKQDFFSDGITEEIISALARISGLFVIARNSSFTYKGKSVWVPDVARDLGVQYILEGSVRRAGDRVRITAQLIEGKTNQHIWSETYDRELKDIFAVQYEITMKILTKVKVRLTGGEDQISPSARRATNLQAYLKILEGIAYQNESRFSEARKAFEEALSLDHNSPAYGWVAWTYIMDVWFGPTATRAQSLGKALEYAEKCIGQDDSNEGCQRTMGCACVMKRDYEKALYHGRRSIELNPNSAISASMLAFILRCAGEYEEAIRECERAMRLDPRSYFHFFQIGTTYVMMKRHEEATQALRKAVEMNPRHMPSWVALVMAYSTLDRMEDARAAAAEVLKLSPNFSVEPFAKAMPYKDEEPRQFMADALRKAGMK